MNYHTVKNCQEIGQLLKEIQVLLQTQSAFRHVDVRASDFSGGPDDAKHIPIFHPQSSNNPTRINQVKTTITTA